MADDIKKLSGLVNDLQSELENTKSELSSTRARVILIQEALEIFQRNVNLPAAEAENLKQVMDQI